MDKSINQYIILSLVHFSIWGAILIFFYKVRKDGMKYNILKIYELRREYDKKIDFLENTIKKLEKDMDRLAAHMGKKEKK